MYKKLILLVFLLIPSISFGATLDQEYTTTPDDGNGFRQAGGVYEFIAQSFTPTVSEPLDSWVFGFAKQLFPSSGTLTVKVYEDSGGSPTGSLICTSDSPSNTAITSTYPDVTEIAFNFSGCDLIASHLYWVVLEGTATMSDVNFNWILGTDADGYAGGEAFKYSGSWASPPSVSDWYFREFYDETGGGEEGIATSTSGSTTLGDISFGIAIIITLMSLGLIGFVWNRITPKKKAWQK